MSDPFPITEQQRGLLADRFFKAAESNALKAESPPDPLGSGEFVHLAAEHYAKAALALAQGFMTLTQPRGTKR